MKKDDSFVSTSEASSLHQRSEPTVFVVEDDDDMRLSLKNTFTKAGLSTRCFRAPSEFLEFYARGMEGCLVVDYQLPEMDGLQLFNTLKEKNSELPFIVISGFATVPRVRDAFHLGVVDFLAKPFGRAELLDKVKLALQRNADMRQVQRVQDSVAARLDLLTPREKEFMSHLADGFETKTIASKLGISHKTAHNHRASILEKMQVDNVPRLIRMILVAQ